MIPLIFLAIVDMCFTRIYCGDLTLASYMTNIVSHSALSLMSIVIFTYSDLDKNDIYQYGHGEVWCGRWLQWYLLYDLTKMFLGVLKNEPIFIIHHVVAFTLVEIIIRKNILHYYLPIICIFEISSIPLNMRIAMRHVGATLADVLWVEVVFAILFVAVRVLFGFNKAYEALNILYNSDAEMVVFISLLFIVAGFVILHAYWLVGIFKRVLYIKNIKTD